MVLIACAWYTLLQDEVRKIEEGSLRTTVAAVYHHHYSTQNPVPVTDHPGSAASDSPSECDMLTNGFISIVLVAEAVAKILRTDLPFTVNTDAVTYWRSFCQMHENKAKIESLPSAETLIGCGIPLHMPIQSIAFGCKTNPQWLRCACCTSEDRKE